MDGLMLSEIYNHLIVTFGAGAAGGSTIALIIAFKKFKQKYIDEGKDKHEAYNETLDEMDELLNK